MTNDYSIFYFNEVQIICTFFPLPSSLFPLTSYLLPLPCSLLPAPCSLSPKKCISPN
ncbi:MAG: hypothetical protein F6K55_37425 [Moorea sp. SIO4A3]|nr:hypothetical protein [Moorena sp. SIO4A3]